MAWINNITGYLPGVTWPACMTGWIKIFIPNPQAR